jgi:hypothetical protein
VIATTILAKVDSGRLQRGVEGLTAGAYNITLMRLTEAEISAYVASRSSGAGLLPNWRLTKSLWDE